jgi:cytochrome c551/c552/ferredoxin
VPDASVPGVGPRRLCSSRLLAVFAGLILASATLGATAASAGTVGSLFPSALAVRPPANAAPPAEQDDSFPKSQQHTGLASVACPSAGNCVAVGDYTVNARDGFSHEEAMAATETKGAWNAGVEIGASLEDVTCTSAGNCVGVGGKEVVAETRGVWGAARKLRLPAGALVTSREERHASLSSVACTSAGNCVAVGSYEDRMGRVRAMVATEAGGSWGVARAIGLPANAVTTAKLRASLDSVACTSAGNCVAVGRYEDTDGSSDRQAMAVTETSGVWGSASEIELPANALVTRAEQRASLSSVACTSVGGCVAVGVYLADDGGHQEAMSVTETSGVWAVASEIGLPENAAPVPGGQYGELGSVACMSAGNCVAVGDYFARNEMGEAEVQAGMTEALVTEEEPMAATETNGIWAAASTTILPGDGFSDSQENALSSVACTSSASECVAVGTYLNACAPLTYTCVDDGSGGMVLGRHLRRARARHPLTARR